MQVYKAGEKTPSAIDLHRELNVLKKNEIPWMYEVSKCAPLEALRNLDKTYANFFRWARLKKQGKHDGKVGFPKFKSRKRGYGSFRLTGTIRVYEDSVQLPRLGMLRLKERGYLPAENETVHILSATVSERAGRWFVSLQVEEEVPDPKANDKPLVGVDLGINALAAVSDGMVIENPRALEKKLVKIRRPRTAACFWNSK